MASTRSVHTKKEKCLGYTGMQTPRLCKPKNQLSLILLGTNTCPLFNTTCGQDSSVLFFSLRFGNCCWDNPPGLAKQGVLILLGNNTTSAVITNSFCSSSSSYTFRTQSDKLFSELWSPKPKWPPETAPHQQVILIPRDVENLGAEMSSTAMSEHVLNPVSGLLQGSTAAVF